MLITSKDFWIISILVGGKDSKFGSREIRLGLYLIEIAIGIGIGIEFSISVFPEPFLYTISPAAHIDDKLSQNNLILSYRTAKRLKLLK